MRMNRITGKKEIQGCTFYIKCLSLRLSRTKAISPLVLKNTAGVIPSCILRKQVNPLPDRNHTKFVSWIINIVSKHQYKLKGMREVIVGAYDFTLGEVALLSFEDFNSLATQYENACHERQAVATSVPLLSGLGHWHWPIQQQRSWGPLISVVHTINAEFSADCGIPREKFRVGPFDRTTGKSPYLIWANSQRSIEEPQGCILSCVSTQANVLTDRYIPVHCRST